MFFLNGVANHEKSLPVLLFYAKYTGSDALQKGQAVAFDMDRGTATAEDGTRLNYVEALSSTNHLNFAGWVANDYIANATDHSIQIHAPGFSVCPVSILDDATAQSGATRGTFFSALVGNGRSILAGNGSGMVIEGAGLAEAIQTNASGSKFKSIDGTATQSSTSITKASHGLAAGDEVHIVGGATTTTMADLVTTGKYLVSSITSSSVFVVDSAPSAVAASVSLYARTGNQTALCLTYPRSLNSGCTEWITPDSATAVASMVGGFTNIFGGATITTDSTLALADGKFSGQFKGWKLQGALTTNDYVVTPDTAGVKEDGTTAWSTALEFDGASDTTLIQWSGLSWRTVVNSGTAYV